ncbi:hypothetical protein [Candidatus Contubernalis alkaliaceticus]|uniref:hypothetical protein n=1 Tax=Candidatus Contubernalis alkaliaceticus TaxID=338645 RepID=UPI001F4C2F41|nr:hypothetical protein [Candidatus Contubernalis alkalaceticus]UNC92324.1 hypothetical protein HUE98_09570 [Candidatus Contubernalis alkalaceticus]
MRKINLAVFLILVMAFSFVLGCGSDSETAPAEETKKQETNGTSKEEEQGNGEEEPSLSNNQSAVLCTSYEAYLVFTGLELGTGMEEVIAEVTELGMVEKKPMEETVFKTQSAQYAFEDEMKESYFEIEFSGDNLVRKLYHVPLNINLETGFHPTKSIYDDMHEKIKAGEVNNLKDVEAYFGPSYLFAEVFGNYDKPEDGIKRTYRWHGGNHYIDVYTDGKDDLEGFKIGSSALPD